MCGLGCSNSMPTAGALSREGVPVRLQPQPARVLAVLVGRLARSSPARR